jgi:serine acetyltransferase
MPAVHHAECIGNMSVYHAEVCGAMLQYRCTQTLAVDIHPAATIGKGVLLDHGTGLVIGETAVVGNNVSILHNVTLGGASTVHDHAFKQHDIHAAALSMLSL